MNTERENWIDEHLEEYEFLKSIEWIGDKYPKVYEQFMKDMEDHAWECKHDPAYRHTYGGGIVPVPCCEYCEYFDDGVGHPGYCMRDVNNNDITNIPYQYRVNLEREYCDLCESYEWNGNWKED